MAEDCPLCCEPMMECDQRFPLNCKTETCHFDFCRPCIQKLYNASSQDYSEASDGSKQVKIALQCPQCRAPYEYRDASTQHLIIRSADVVQAVLDLRLAAGTPLPSDVPDHELSSTVLAARMSFTEQVGQTQLKQAIHVLQQYYDSFASNPVGTIDPEVVEAWIRYLPEQGAKTPVSLTLDRDPTLLYGLDQFLTVDEQEYITNLLVSNNPKFLEQAAHLLSSVMTCPRPPVNDSTPAFVEKCHRVKKKYPLPRTMPRCVSLPMFNPLDESKSNPLHFEPVTLQIKRATGPAARLGLRKGDIVTHVAGELVERWDAYVVGVQQLQIEEQVTLTINADAETAQALYDRSCRMRKEGVRFT